LDWWVSYSLDPFVSQTFLLRIAENLFVALLQKKTERNNKNKK